MFIYKDIQEFNVSLPDSRLIYLKKMTTTTFSAGLYFVNLQSLMFNILINSRYNVLRVTPLQFLASVSVSALKSISLTS